MGWPKISPPKITVPKVKIEPAKTINDTLKQAKKLKDNIDRNLTEAKAQVDQAATKAKNDLDREATIAKKNMDATATDLKKDFDDSLTKAKQDIDATATDMKQDLDNTLTKAKQDIDRELKDAYKDVKRETEKGIQKTGAALAAMGKPENLARMAIVYAASAYGGPMGSAFANAILDKYIFKKDMTDQDLFNSFIIGAAAGYAGEYAGSGNTGYDFVDSIPHASSQISQNLSTDVGNVLMNGEPYAFEDFVSSIATGSATLKTGTSASYKIFDSAINEASNYTIDTAVKGEAIDIDKLSDKIYDGVAKGVTSKTVDSLMETYVMPHLPEEQRLDKEMFKTVSQALTSVFEATQFLENYNEGKVRYGFIPENIDEEELWEGIEVNGRAPAGGPTRSLQDLDTRNMTIAEKMNFVLQVKEYLAENPVNDHDIQIGKLSDKEVAVYTAKKLIEEIDREWNGAVKSKLQEDLEGAIKDSAKSVIDEIAEKVVNKLIGSKGNLVVLAVDTLITTEDNGEVNSGEIYGRRHLMDIQNELAESTDKAMKIRIEKLPKPEVIPVLKIKDWSDENASIGEGNPKLY